MKVLYPIDISFVEHVDDRKPDFDAKRVRQCKEELLKKFKREGFYLIDASERPMPENADLTTKKRIFQPTTQPIEMYVLYDFRKLWRSPRFC